MYDDNTSRYFLTLKQIKEAKRDPLEHIDSLAIPDTKVWGQSKMPADKTSGKNYDTSTEKKNRGHSPSDSEEATDKIQGTKPTKPSTVKI